MNMARNKNRAVFFGTQNHFGGNVRLQRASVLEVFSEHTPPHGNSSRHARKNYSNEEIT